MQKSLFKIKGKVIKGDQRGRDLGFPTANIEIVENIQEGIYISRVKIGKEDFNAVTFIGASKTFGSIEVKAEIYILDFNRNIYGFEIKISFLKKIRDNKKFNSEKDLIEAMDKDLEEARKYFNLV